jgi:hypothetical protein
MARRQTKKARAASMRNLAKAKKALRRHKRRR